MVPPFGHGVAGVDDEVHQRELELGAVGKGAPELVVDAPFELDQPAQRMGEQLA